MLYLTSDTHFFHKNIYGPEGFVPTRTHFSTVEEMNDTIIENWNNKITQHDTVIHAGDVSLHARPQILFDLLRKLNGNIEIVLGNHDSMSKQMKYLINNNYSYNGKPKFTIHEVGKRIKFNKKVYYVTHYPLQLGDKRSLIRNFCGHIHELPTNAPNQLNIGIDSPEIGDRPFGEPIRFEEAVDLIENKWRNQRRFNKPKPVL